MYRFIIADSALNSVSVSNTYINIGGSGVLLILALRRNRIKTIEYIEGNPKSYTLNINRVVYLLMYLHVYVK